MIEERIESELKNAIKEKGALKISCLRMLKSDIHNLFIEKRQDMKEEDIIKVIQKQVRQHKESIEQFAKGNRNDLVDKEKKELAILESFLPQQMPEDELKKTIQGVIKELGVTEKKDTGRVMKEVMAKVKGKADGKLVSQIVSGLLE